MRYEIRVRAVSERSHKASDEKRYMFLSRAKDALAYEQNLQNALCAVLGVGAPKCFVYDRWTRKEL